MLPLDTILAAADLLLLRILFRLQWGIIAMSDSLVLLIVVGFGAVTWILLVVSDWLWGDTTHDRK
jgi:hypothetical protein